MSSASPAVLISRKRRRKKIIFRVFLLLLVLVSVVFAAGVGLFFVDKFKIKRVAVEGNSVLSEGEIRQKIEKTMSENFWGIIPRNRFFSFPGDKVKSNLISVFGRLDSVEIKKENPSTIIVSVSEREPVSILCVEGSKDCFFIDKTGLIFEEAPFFSSGVFVRFSDLRREKSSFGQVLVDKETLERLFGFVDKVGPFFQITDIYLEDGGVYRLQDESDTQIILGKKDDWSLAFSNLETFLRDYRDGKYPSFEYIDMRFGNKVFYKTK